MVTDVCDMVTEHVDMVTELGDMLTEDVDTVIDFGDMLTEHVRHGHRTCRYPNRKACFIPAATGEPWGGEGLLFRK